VTKDASGKDVAYIAWDSTTAGLLRGRSYAIYVKAGAPAAAGPFARQGIAPPAPTPAALAPLLAQATGVGANPASLVEPLVALGATPGAPLAEQLAAVLTASQTNPKVSGMLDLLAKAHPAIELAVGRAWSGPIGAGENTVEIREYDPRTDRDVATVARLTVTAGVVVPLPAPGVPVQVPDLTATGDLLIKLRWATPPELRRRSALTRGYNAWRLPRADAERLGWLIQPPSLADLIANARRANATPILTARDFDAVSGLTFADPDAHFVRCIPELSVILSSTGAHPLGF
jgi:hypothetical protein